MYHQDCKANLAHGLFHMPDTTLRRDCQFWICWRRAIWDLGSLYSKDNYSIRVWSERWYKLL